MSFDFAARVDRARALMSEGGIGALLLSIGPDLPYFTGYEAKTSERLTMAIIPDAGVATMLVPELEAPKVEPRPGLELRPWGETEDPLDLVTSLVGGRSHLAIGDHTRAIFLIGLGERLPGSTFTSATPLTRRLRARKDRDEVELLRRAAAAADQVSTALGAKAFSGLTERGLASEVEAMAVAAGHDEAWSAIVASGPNAASPHHQPEDRTIGPGDTVVVDFGGRVGGYHSDTTRTYCVGEPAPEVAAAYATLHEAHRAGVSAARPGAPAQAVDRAARTVIADAGFGELFIHRTGHGIGLEIHEHPYLVEGNDEHLEPGMAFSVEPGIYMPGEWGMRIEDIVVSTPDGAEVLNQAQRHLAVVE